MRRLPLAPLALALLAACAAGEPAAEDAPRKQVIFAGDAAPIAPYSPGIRTGGLVFFSGQIGVSRDTAAEQGVQAETRRALERLDALLTAADLAPADVVKCTVFLADIGDYGAMNEVYGEFFGEMPPARSAIAVAALPAGARVEIECIAAASPARDGVE